MTQPHPNPRFSAPLGAGLFRLHIENGLSVSLCTALVGLGTAALFDRSLAVLAVTGALCASVVDQPGPAPIKARMFAASVCGSTLLTVLTILSADHPWALGLVVAGLSFASGLVSAYGRRALGWGVAAVLALLFGMAPQGELPLAWHAVVFFGGGIAYSLFALAIGYLLDDRYRRLFLAEAVRGFGEYVAAKAGDLRTSFAGARGAASARRGACRFRRAATGRTRHGVLGQPHAAAHAVDDRTSGVARLLRNDSVQRRRHRDHPRFEPPIICCIVSTR